MDYNDPFRAKEVPLSIDEEAHLRAPENRVVGLTSSEFQDSGNVLKVEHILHAHT